MLCAVRLAQPVLLRLTTLSPPGAERGEGYIKDLQSFKNFVSLKIYQGLTPVSGLLSSLKKPPVGPFWLMVAYLTTLAAASSTVPGPLW